ncbi:MAG: cytochrome c3 family protein [Phycisphaerae bacterium]
MTRLHRSCPRFTRRAAAAALLLLSAGAARAQSSQPQRPTSATPNCTNNGCHAEVRSFPVLHGPIAAGSCTGCHTLSDAAAHKFTLARPGNDLCTFCHEPPVGTVVHQPLKSGSCRDCHQPHGGQTRGFLAAGTVAATCVKCHKDVTGGKSVVHGPVAAGGCVACHSPHASNYPKLLLKEGRQLCIECHVSTQQQLETASVKHKPAGENCLLCHDAHASAEKMMLRQAPQPLCLSCHANIKSTVEHAKTQHGAVVEGRQCLNCHEPHATNFPRILRNNPMALCLECHNKPIKTPQGTVADMSAVLAPGKSLHGPVAQKNCAACHQIHGGDHFRLLTQEYPPEFYAPFKEQNYALCFSCHERALVLEAKTTTLTGFRNGDTNLHYLHVNKDTKGRTCRACHETHASDQAKHIRDSVPFGKWEMPIRFEKTETGGSCAPGCHVPYAYDRKSPRSYPPATSPAKWPAVPPTGGAP